MFHRITRPMASLVLLASTLLFVIGSTPGADAAPASNCGHGTGGAYASAICWFDMAAFDDALASSTGQTMTFAVGDYVVTATVSDTQTGATRRNLAAVPPIGSSIGLPGYYAGIPGSPVLYTDTGTQNPGNRITFRNISVTLDGQPVSGFQLVAAHAETLDSYQSPFGEYVAFQSDVPLVAIDHAPTFTTGGGCPIPALGSGTTAVSCFGAAAGQTAANGVIVAATNPSTLSAEVGMTTRGEREGVAFGIMTASVDVTKQVDGRVDADDSFDVAIESSGGTVLAGASTGTAASASTGAEVVVAGGTFTLTDAPTPGNGALPGNYTAAWDCTNATAGSTTTLPTGSGSSQDVTLAPGDEVACTVTNTAKTASISLLKTVDTTDLEAGQAATFSFEVTNTGELPLSDVEVIEDAFSGSAGPLTVSCPATTLAPGASMTCTAPYTVTQADVDAGLVSNTASAEGTPPGTTTPVSSPPSSAVIVGNAAPRIDLTKVADHVTATDGDVVTYTLTATNTGNQTLTDVVIAEGAFSGLGALGALVCPGGQPTTLAPGASSVCTATYAVQPGDVPSGSLVNDADVTATAGSTVTDDATATVTLLEPPTTTTTTAPTTTTTSTTSTTTSTTAPTTTTTTAPTTTTTSTTTSTTEVPTSTTSTTEVPTSSTTTSSTTTSTTEAPASTTSTTEAPTSTTSTTVAPTTSTSAAASSTTAVPTSTTGSLPGGRVGNGSGTVGTTGATGVGSLPRTGANVSALVVWGFGFVLIGFALVSRSRRLRRA